MSYNIDTFKLKKLEDLIIPVDEFFIHERKDYHPSRRDNDDKTTTFQFDEMDGMTGYVVKGLFYVESIDLGGEFSGTAMACVIEPALKKSTGIMEASTVWEGGDSIAKIIVDNGYVKWEDIEI